MNADHGGGGRVVARLLREINLALVGGGSSLFRFISCISSSSKEKNNYSKQMPLLTGSWLGHSKRIKHKLCRKCANFLSAARRARALGVSPLTSSRPAQAPARTRTSQIRRRLPAAALCSAVCLLCVKNKRYLQNISSNDTFESLSIVIQWWPM